jgi:prepilin-type N-terminal cleavage/methylation domain-containing protein
MVRYCADIPTKHTSSHGFTLLEVSIVIVIIGLLTGAVLAGQDLVRAAQLRSVVNEFHTYKTAVYNFRDKYGGIPGDFARAERFWGTMSTGTCPNAIGGTGTQTCNGDGDGRIERNGSVSRSNETFTFWQQLANSGLIEGRFTGIAGSGSTNDSEVGLNAPPSKLDGTGWSVGYYASDGNSPPTYFTLAAPYRNSFIIGIDSPNFQTSLPALRPEEAWNIDQKVDDGFPASGKIISIYWNNLCTEAVDGTPATDDLNAVYRVTDSSVQCALCFIRSF